MEDEDRFNPFASKGHFDEEDEAGLYDEEPIDTKPQKGKSKAKASASAPPKKAAKAKAAPPPKKAKAPPPPEEEEDDFTDLERAQPHDDEHPDDHDGNPERNLQRREAELARREQDASKQDAHKKRKANWPKFYPIIYHNIDMDIKNPYRQKICRWLYLLFFINIGVLFFNWIGIICAWGENVLSSDEQYLYFFFALIYFLFGSICGWFCWYRVLYNAFRLKGRVFKYKLFLAFYGAQVLFKVFLILGIKDTGAAGIVILAQTVHAKVFSTIVFITNILILATDLTFGVIIWILVFRYQRKLKDTAEKKAPVEEDGGMGFTPQSIVQSAVKQTATNYLKTAASKFDSVQ